MYHVSISIVVGYVCAIAKKFYMVMVITEFELQFALCPL